LSALPALRHAAAFTAAVAVGLWAPVAVVEAQVLRVIDVGGTQIALRVFGSSGPSILFEAGLGEDAGSFTPLAQQLSRCAKAALYDRPGTGKSGPRAGDVVLAGTVADELDALMSRAGIPPPFVLVGHSLGGLYVQAYARTRPDKVAAVVLIDATSPLEPPGLFAWKVLPKPGTVAAAEAAGVAESIAALRAGPPFPPVPLIVIVANDPLDTPARRALWREVQARTAALSPKGRLVEVSSGHFVKADKPQVVMDAILDAVTAAGYDVTACRHASRPRPAGMSNTPAK
jgi:pimeloyl-ACP methyl ester carboxylesterase